MDTQLTYGFTCDGGLLRILKPNEKYLLGTDIEGVLSMPWSLSFGELLHVIADGHTYDGTSKQRPQLPYSEISPVAVITTTMPNSTTVEYCKFTLPEKLPDIATCYTQDVNCRTLYAIQLPSGSEPLQVNGIYHSYFNDHTDDINGANTFKCICGGKWDLEYLLLVLTEDEVQESLLSNHITG